MYKQIQMKTMSVKLIRHLKQFSMKNLLNRLYNNHQSLKNYKK
jgi:hypothetical protein